MARTGRRRAEVRRSRAPLVLLLVALVVTNPRRMTRETRWSRLASIGLACLIIVTNCHNVRLAFINWSIGNIPN